MKDQIPAQGIKEFGNFLQAIKLAWNKRKEQLIYINKLHKDLSRSIRSNANQETIKQKAANLEHILYEALNSRIFITPRDQLRKVIFICLRSLLDKLINDICSYQTEKKLFDIQLYCTCLRLLEFRFDQVSNIVPNLDNSMHESESPPNLSHPPRWRFILFMITPISFVSLFLFPPGLMRFQIAQKPNPPAKPPLCNPLSFGDRGVLNKAIVDVSGAGSGHWEKIKWTYTNTSSNSNPSASRIAEAFDDYLKNTVNIDQQKHNTIINNLPWIKILANNEKIDQIKKDSSSSTVNIFNVLVVIPFGSDNSPPAWSLGILKGINLAQSKLIEEAQSKPNEDKNKNKKKNFIKVIILDETKAIQIDKFSKLILDLVNSISDPTVAIVGLGQDIFVSLHNDCPREYIDIPFITSSIRYPQEVASNIAELNLLPTLPKIAKGILDDIKNHRKEIFAKSILNKNNNRKEENLKMELKPKRLIIVYDQSDRKLVDLMCELVQEQYKIDFPKCELIEINNVRFNSEPGSLNFDKENNHELILAVNPFNDRTQIEKFILDYFQSFFESKAKTGWMYVSPYFMDKLLEEWISDQACNQVGHQNCTKFKSSFFLIRVAPLDWRTITPDQKKLYEDIEEIKDPYGKRLNWSTLNSYNNFMALHELIEKEVFSLGKANSSNLDYQTFVNIRKEIGDKLRENKYEFKNTLKLITENGITILPAKINILPLQRSETKSD
jgi:hypothetical protein